MTEIQPKQYVEPLHLCPKCGEGENAPDGFRFVAAPGGGLWACECGASWRTPNWVTPAAPADDDAEPVLPDLTDDATQTEALNLLVMLQGETYSEAIYRETGIREEIDISRMLAAIHNKLYDEWAEPVDVPGVTISILPEHVETLATFLCRDASEGGPEILRTYGNKMRAKLAATNDES